MNKIIYNIKIFFILLKRTLSNIKIYKKIKVNIGINCIGRKYIRCPYCNNYYYIKGNEKYTSCICCNNILEIIGN